MLRTRLTTALIAAGMLAACGNDPEITASRTLLANITDTVRGRSVEPSQLTQAQIAQSLAASAPRSVMLLSLDNTQTQATIIQIERNRDHRTYATADRLSFTFKDGFLTSTRGLGDDLMSSRTEESAQLVRSGQPGLAKRQMRYLTGDDQTLDLTFECVISVAGQEQGLLGMREDCRSGAITFINTYAVGPGGQVVASRQWTGRINEYATLALLRD